MIVSVAGAAIEESARLRLEIKHHIGLAKLKEGLGVRVDKSRICPRPTRTSLTMILPSGFSWVLNMQIG